MFGGPGWKFETEIQNRHILVATPQRQFYFVALRPMNAWVSSQKWPRDNGGHSFFPERLLCCNVKTQRCDDSSSALSLSEPQSLQHKTAWHLVTTNKEKIAWKDKKGQEHTHTFFWSIFLALYRIIIIIIIYLSASW
jgi:hypothetical protein